MSYEPLEIAILVADDDPVVLQTLCECLGTFGFTSVLRAKNGLEAWQLLQSNPVQLIICDWEMPGMSGQEVLEKVRGDERFSELGFIMVTSPVSQERTKITQAATRSVDAYLLKPFRTEILRERIAQVLTRKRRNVVHGALVVEDNTEVRETIVEYLHSSGFGRIHEAADGEEAYAILKDRPDEISFVVSDWEMPNLTGLGLLTRVRADESLADKPFIMVTSQSGLDQMKFKMAFDAEVDQYLLKPFRAKDLKAKIDEALRLSKARTRIRKLHREATSFIEARNLGKAKELLNRILTLSPRNIQALLGLAEVDLLVDPRRNLEVAVQLIRRAIEVDPTYDETHLALAKVFEGARSIGKAIVVLREALANCDSSPEVHFHLGRLLFIQGNEPDGIAELKRALEISPGHPGAKKLLAAHEKKK